MFCSSNKKIFSVPNERIRGSPEKGGEHNPKGTRGQNHFFPAKEKGVKNIEVYKGAEISKVDFPYFHETTRRL